MTALERIKEIESKIDDVPFADVTLFHSTEQVKFILKAFQVMREIALEIDLEQFESGEAEKELDEEFERRMKDEETKKA